MNNFINCQDRYLVSCGASALHQFLISWMQSPIIFSSSADLTFNKSFGFSTIDLSFDFKPAQIKIATKQLNLFDLSLLETHWLYWNIKMEFEVRAGRRRRERKSSTLITNKAFPWSARIHLNYCSGNSRVEECHKLLSP